MRSPEGPLPRLRLAEEAHGPGSKAAPVAHTDGTENNVVGWTERN